MSFFYFNQLAKQGQESKLRDTVNYALRPFDRYLGNAIDSLKNKEIKVRWKPAPEFGISLEPIHKVYELSLQTEIKIGLDEGWYSVDGIKDLDYEEPIKIRKVKKSVKINKTNVRRIGGQLFLQLPFKEIDLGAIIWGFESGTARAAWIPTSEITDIEQGYPIDFEILQDKILLNGVIDKNQPLLVNEQPYPFETIKNEVDLDKLGAIKLTQKGISSDTKKLMIAVKKPLPRKITAKEIRNYWTAENIGSFEVEKHQLSPAAGKKLIYNVSNETVFKKRKTITSSLGIECYFKIDKPDFKDINRYWIQLLEDDADGPEDFGARSKLEYFFDDDVEIELVGDQKGGKPISYSVAPRGKNYEEKKIVLKEGRSWRYKMPDPRQIKYLKVRVNTYQLKKQRNAINNLREKPLLHLAPLINIFRPLKQIEWPSFEQEKITEWQVLTREDFPGNEEQRDFVEKAMATPDFAILEGPPGSGKTTAILELVCQLVQRGKKILFCGSTHVAIDNVLERLKDKEELLENILPVRIGDRARISEIVREFQLQQIVEDSGVGERLILDAANLVCGTTIGILQHSYFKPPRNREEQKEHWEKPIEPFYDYLIIDESSKTTFQEFLVPALYAKRWILVGDIKQLSPYADREPVVSNLAKLEYRRGEELSQDLQTACLIWQKIPQYDNNLIIKANKGVIKCLQDEFIARKSDKNIQGKEICFVSANLHGKEVMKGRDLPRKAIELAAYDLIFIENGLFNKYSKLLPANFAVIRDRNWAESSHAFQQIHYDKTAKEGKAFFLKDRGRELRTGLAVSEHYNNFFEEKSWAEELGWRIIRKFELSQLKKQAPRIAEDIKKLYPKLLGSTDVEKAVQLIETIALPSVLECLQSGLNQRGIRQAQSTTLTKGLDKGLKYRHVCLSYQHRMHPDISKFPRAAFYEKNALLDNPKLTEYRKWAYKKYKQRSVWIHAADKEVYRNKNKSEAGRIIQEIKEFMKWAKKNPKSDGSPWEIAVLTFYRGQESLLRERINILLGRDRDAMGNRFNRDKAADHNIYIKLNTVDKFQGQEADIVFISMVQNRRIGFMDSPNRLNVAITRARFQLVIVGNYDFFLNKNNKFNNRSEELQQLAKSNPTLLT